VEETESSNEETKTERRTSEKQHCSEEPVTENL